MLGLLRTDFKKIFKSVLLYVGMGVVVIFPLFFFGLMKIEMPTTDISGGAMVVTQLIDFALSPMLITGLMVPTFGAILTGSDFSSGMTRNKIICGQSKNKIYLSYLISTACLILFLSLLSFGSYMLFGQLMFNIWTELKAERVLWYLFSGLLGYVFISTFVILLTTLMKNAASIPFVVLTDLIIGVVSMTVIPVIQSVIAQSGGEPLPDIIYLVPFYGVTVMRDLTGPQMFFSLGIFVALIGVNLLLGFISFKRTDIK